MSGRKRLDIALEERGLCPSRARARDAVLRGTVRVNGETVTKPGRPVGDDDAITISDQAIAYVARSALKLIAALDAGGIDVSGLACLDAGASTGGFTQVLLERGAKRVYAVDVGHGQLHKSLKADKRVISLEGTNARDLDAALIPEPIDLLVADLSFVSVRKVLQAPLALCGEKARAIILIKPQFEVGRDHIGKGGIVTDRVAAREAIDKVIGFVDVHGFALEKTLLSPIAGGDGNIETLAIFRRKPMVAA